MLVSKNLGFFLQLKQGAASTAFLRHCEIASARGLKSLGYSKL